jgi:hypothetical protein
MMAQERVSVSHTTCVALLVAVSKKVFTEIVMAQTFFCEQAQSQHEVLYNAKGSYKYIYHNFRI